MACHHPGCTTSTTKTTNGIINTNTTTNDLERGLESRDTFSSSMFSLFLILMLFSRYRLFTDSKTTTATSYHHLTGTTTTHRDAYTGGIEIRVIEVSIELEDKIRTTVMCLLKRLNVVPWASASYWE